MIKEGLVAQWTESLALSLPTARLLSCYPTASGNSIQARIGYTLRGKNGCGYVKLDNHILSRSVHDSAMAFSTFIDRVYRLKQNLEKSLSRGDAFDTAEEIKHELICAGFPSVTLPLRKRIFESMNAMVSTAKRKCMDTELSKCRKQIPRWFDSALSHNMDPEELIEMLNQATVRSVLKS